MRKHLVMASAATLVGGVLVAAAATPASAASGTGPNPASYETASNLANHTIYRPDNLPTDKMPVMVWGNGGCSGRGLDQQPFLEQIASYGYLVIASGAPGGGPSTTSAMMQASIDWAVAENTRQGSKYFGRLLTDKIAAAGWSCGGLEAYAVSGDPHVATTMIFSSGLLNDADDYQLRRLDHPIGYFIGGPGDIAYNNAMDDWGKLPSTLPAWMGNLNVGHGGTYTQPNGGEFGRVGVLWANWQLKGDQAAGANFVGPNCTLCRGGQWQVQQKNLTLSTPTPTPTTTTPTPTTTSPTTNSTPPTTTTTKPTKTGKVKIVKRCKTGKNGKKTCKTITRTVNKPNAACGTVDVTAAWAGGWVATVTGSASGLRTPAAAGVTEVLPAGSTLLVRGTGDPTAVSVDCTRA
ncbi:MAG: hypothetical protein U0Q15_04185 [Kineosporiaceae bacterium]